GRSRELWMAAMKPEEEGSPSVVPKEPIRVGAKTQSASLGGFISHKLKEEGVALLQGSSAVTIAKMADGIAIAGAHFNGEEGRPSAHLVCRLRTILVEADATVSRDGEEPDHAAGDGSPSGDTTVPPRPNRIRVMQILVRLKEGPIQGSSSSSAAAAQPHSEDEANDAEVTIDSISARHGRHTLLNTATAGPSRPAYRLPPPQFAIDSQFKFKVEAEAHPVDIGDLIMKVSMSNRHTVVLQAQGVAAAAVAVKGFIEANAPRSRTCHLVISGAPPDEVGRRGGPSTVLWLSSYRAKDPNLFVHDSVETMVVSNHTKPAPLAGSISTSIEQGNVVRLQGAGPHCLKKMTEALAISGRHFSEGRQPRPDARRGPGLLVCWPRFVAARAPSAGHDRGPKGVVEIYVALEEHASSDSAEQERRRDLTNREDEVPEAPPRMLTLCRRVALPHHVGLVSCSVGARRGFRTLATKEMQQAEDRLRVTSSADPVDLAPFIRQRLGTPNMPNVVVLQAVGRPGGTFNRNSRLVSSGPMLSAER
ncbi:Lysophosphatidylcholine acyltransferase 2, partial [Perkinsus olseni]